MAIIALIDDEQDILDILSFNFKKENHEVHCATNGIEGLKLCKKIVPDIAIIDVMMPEMDGIELCEELRKTPELSNLKIALLTARNEDYSQIAGLEAGADDYISKPIKPKVLIARINALLRRGGVQSVGENTDLEELVVDRSRYLVIKNGVEIQLPKKEFELLSLLHSKPGNVFERNFILETVWGNDVIVGDRTIDVHVRKLREKIGGEYIQTIKGIGYKFVNT